MMVVLGEYWRISRAISRVLEKFGVMKEMPTIS